jgi:hypothetical protein
LMVTGFSAEPVWLAAGEPQAARAAADAEPIATVVMKLLLLIIRASLLGLCKTIRSGNWRL